MKSRRTCLLGIASIVSLGFLRAIAENTDVLQQQIIAQARAVGPDDFAFTRTIGTEESASDKTERHVLIERWDPTKAPDQRWTFVSLDGRAPTSDELGKYRGAAAKRRVPTYGRVAEYFTGRPSSVSELKGRTVYSFASFPKGSVVVNEIDFSADAHGEVIVGGESGARFVEDVRFNSTKSTRVKIVAVIESLQTTTHFRLLANGKPVPAQQTTDVTGSLLGKHGRIRTTIEYTEQRAVR